MPIRDSADAVIPELAGLQRRFLSAGVLGAAVSLLGLFLNPTQFLQSYLMGYMLCLGVTLGCLALGWSINCRAARGASCCGVRSAPQAASCRS
jgi:hypothetical protein